MSKPLCSTNIAKGLMLFTGLCYVGCAGALLYIGGWVLSTYVDYDEIADSTLTVLPASMILAVSVFMCMIGVMACISAFKQNKYLLAFFFSMILVVFVGESLAGIIGYMYRSQVLDIMDDNLSSAVDNYNITSIKEQIDSMQQEFECCGVNNATDWLDSAYWKQNHTDTVPESCCKPVTGNATCNPIVTSNDIYQVGCLTQMDDEFKTNLVVIATVVVLLAALQALALLSTCILVCRTRDERTYHTLNEDSTSGGLRV